MKRLILTISTIAILIFHAQGQEEGFYRHYLLSPVLINPAYTGFEDQHNLIFNYNRQWADFDGGPNTVTANYNGPVGEQIGLGITLLSDNAASLTRNRTTLSYAFKFMMNELDLSLGLATTFEQLRLKGTALLQSGIDVSDPVLVDASGGLKLFDAAFGAHAKYQEFFFGIASPNLIRARVNRDPLVKQESPGLFESFLAYVGYNWAMEDNNFWVEPSLMVRSLRNSPFQVDFNGKIHFFEDQLIGGLTYTLGGGDRFAILLGTALTNFDLFYSYTTSFQQSQAYHSGAHEISIRFRFGERKKKMNEDN